MSEFWQGHWQNIADTTHFFSVGSIPIGPQEIVMPRFFFSNRDRIESSFYMESLEDFDHKKRWKVFYTSEDQYLKIQALSSTRIEVFGPVGSKEDLPMKKGTYEQLRVDVEPFAAPPFSDSILYGIK